MYVFRNRHSHKLCMQWKMTVQHHVIRFSQGQIDVFQDVHGGIPTTVWKSWRWRNQLHKYAIFPTVLDRYKFSRGVWKDPLCVLHCPNYVALWVNFKVVVIFFSVLRYKDFSQNRNSPRLFNVPGTQKILGKFLGNCFIRFWILKWLVQSRIKLHGILLIALTTIAWLSHILRYYLEFFSAGLVNIKFTLPEDNLSASYVCFTVHSVYCAFTHLSIAWRGPRLLRSRKKTFAKVPPKFNRYLGCIFVNVI